MILPLHSDVWIVRRFVLPFPDCNIVLVDLPLEDRHLDKPCDETMHKSSLQTFNTRLFLCDNTHVAVTITEKKLDTN